MLLRIFGQLLVVIFLLVLVYGGVQLAFLAGAQPSTALRLPMSVPYMITPVAATLMAVASILRLVELCSRLLPGCAPARGRRMIMLALVVLLVATLVVGVPIAFAMGIVAVAGLGLSGLGSGYVVAQRLFSGMNSYPLLALALFILAGNILVEGKVITHLVRFVDLLVGRVRGGLAQANVLANMLMAGVSGSATADAAALGSIMLPMMREKGYRPEFSAALTISAAVMGPIIPPSLVMVIYAIPSKLSVGALFLGGVVPGLLIGLSLMVLAYVMCRRQQGLVALEREPWSETGGIMLRALPVMVGPVIVVGGILGGVFTATEFGGRAGGLLAAPDHGFLSHDPPAPALYRADRERADHRHRHAAGRHLEHLCLVPRDRGHSDPDHQAVRRACPPIATYSSRSSTCSCWWSAAFSTRCRRS